MMHPALSARNTRSAYKGQDCSQGNNATRRQATGVSSFGDVHIRGCVPESLFSAGTLKVQLQARSYRPTPAVATFSVRERSFHLAPDSDMLHYQPQQQQCSDLQAGQIRTLLQDTRRPHPGLSMPAIALTGVAETIQTDSLGDPLSSTSSSRRQALVTRKSASDDLRFWCSICILSQRPESCNRSFSSQDRASAAVIGRLCWVNETELFVPIAPKGNTTMTAAQHVPKADNGENNVDYGISKQGPAAPQEGSDGFAGSLAV
ncbi:hypothetical protein QBC36DRAFT_367531 [Triangularia setosa]|uniref:Uncharacterized protein n=1 Tax=Triangularia setosa TaxID=2587417 RepID=A0AAN6VXW5_9PEZI|nr:hypothetical protein QBC36DRAFT_367531 [Podospora setosa]